MLILEKHISNSYKAMDNVKAKFGKLSAKIDNIQTIEAPEQKHLLASTEVNK